MVDPTRIGRGEVQMPSKQEQEHKPTRLKPGSQNDKAHQVPHRHYGFHEIAEKEGWNEGIENPIDVDGLTFGEALRVAEGIREKLEACVASLPRRSSQIYLPGTLSEATSYVNAREDAKKKQGVPRLGGDVVSVMAERYGAHPGVLEGGGDAAAFWLYTADYFRNVCVEDIHEILSFLTPLEKDDAFCCEILGRKNGQGQHGEKHGEEEHGTPGSGRRSRRANIKLVDIVPAIRSPPTAASGTLLGPEDEQGKESQQQHVMSTSLTPEGAPAQIPLDVLETDRMMKLAQTVKQISILLGNTNSESMPKLDGKSRDEMKTILRNHVADLQMTHEDLKHRDNSTPSPVWIHPWTKMLLQTMVPHHVKEAVKEPYHLEPPGSLNLQYQKKDEEDQCEEKVEKHIEKVNTEVLDVIAQGIPDSELEGAKPSKHYDMATENLEIILSAPQDELTAETLALQAELASVMAANRARLVPALAALVDDLPKQRARDEELNTDFSFAKQYFDSIEASKLAGKAAKKDLMPRSLHSSSPNSTRPRLGGAGHSLEKTELYDVLARRNEEDEAFCSVCGDGFSAEPNVILFCDRCDVAVHQKCYDIPDVPQHEWLCWPCKEYEDKMKAEGKMQDEIRPLHSLPEHRRKLPGGSKEVKCFLCPLKFGAFRRSSDGAAWVHQTCAMWHPETYLTHDNGPNVVEGLWDIPEERFHVKCDLCHLEDGAVVPCPEPGCTCAYHVLCARNCGLYLTVQKDMEGNYQHRVYCAAHSKAEQDKDSMPVPPPMPVYSSPPPQIKIQPKQKSAEEIRKDDLETLAMLEIDLSKMHALRVNFESLRVLLDQSKRREKLKKNYLQLCIDAFKERVQDPSLALDFIKKIDTLSKNGYNPLGIVSELWPEDVPASDTNPSKKIKMSQNVSETRLYGLDDKRVSKSGRPRRVTASLEAQKVLNSEQAEMLNQKLPPGIRYVPIEDLNMPAKG